MGAADLKGIQDSDHITHSMLYRIGLRVVRLVTRSMPSRVHQNDQVIGFQPIHLTTGPPGVQVG